MAIMGTGLPQKVMVKHKYVQTISQTIASNALGVFAWRANGMFSPYITAGGHQPMYFDQYSALYEHFCVVGAKVTFKVSHNTLPTSDSAYRLCAFVDSNTAILATNIDGVAEGTLGRTITLVPPTQISQAVKTLNFSAKKTFGKAVLGNKALTGSSTSDPVEQQAFVVCIQGDTGQSTDVLIVAEIEYIAIWTELKEVAQS